MKPFVEPSFSSDIYGRRWPVGVFGRFFTATARTTNLCERSLRVFFSRPANTGYEEKEKDVLERGIPHSTRSYRAGYFVRRGKVPAGLPGERYRCDFPRINDILIIITGASDTSSSSQATHQRYPLSCQNNSPSARRAPRPRRAWRNSPQCGAGMVGCPPH